MAFETKKVLLFCFLLLVCIKLREIADMRKTMACLIEYKELLRKALERQKLTKDNLAETINQNQMYIKKQDLIYEDIKKWRIESKELLIQILEEKKLINKKLDEKIIQNELLKKQNIKILWILRRMNAFMFRKSTHKKRSGYQQVLAN